MGNTLFAIDIDEKAMRRVIEESEGTRDALQVEVDKIVRRANDLSHGMRTGTYHEGGRTLGNTEPQFAGDVQKGKKGKSYIGIVHPKNYAALKANVKSNILLKARG